MGGSVVNGKVQVSQSSKGLEQDLLKANKLLKEQEKLKSALGDILEKSRVIEEKILDNPHLTEYFKTQPNFKHILMAFNELEANLKALDTAVNDFEKSKFKAGLFLESFREFRVYAFKSDLQVLEFLNALFNLFKVNDFTFKPQFAGSPILDALASKFGLPKKSTQGITLPARDLEKTWNFLASNNAILKAKFEASLMKASFTAPNKVSIEADNEKIRRIDRLAKELNAQY